MRKAQILVLAGIMVLAACERRPGNAPKPPPPPNSGPADVGWGVQQNSAGLMSAPRITVRP